MSLQEMLEEALAAIEAMSPEDFESECVKAGYTPVVKHEFSMSEKSMVIDAGIISYRHGVFIDNEEKVEFHLESANDSGFLLAA